MKAIGQLIKEELERQERSVTWFAQKLSCHNGIRNIIKLLENISQTHRNHKLNDQFYRTSCRHIICHRKCTSRPSGPVVSLDVPLLYKQLFL